MDKYGFKFLTLLSCAIFGSLCANEKVFVETFQDQLIVQSSSSESFSPKEAWKQDISDIDTEIDKLTNQRNLYLAKATRLQNQGDRLQFENNNLIDARRAWQQAQVNREIATRIQEEIDALQSRRLKILQKHGISNYPQSDAAKKTK